MCISSHAFAIESSSHVVLKVGNYNYSDDDGLSVHASGSDEVEVGRGPRG